MEQRKLTDQANTVADLAKVSAWSTVLNVLVLVWTHQEPAQSASTFDCDDTLEVTTPLPVHAVSMLLPRLRT